MSEYKVNLNDYNENPPKPWTDEQYGNAFQVLLTKYHEMKAERDTLIDDVAILKSNNDRLMRRIEYLEKFKRRWEKLADWKKGKFEEYNKHNQYKAMQSNNDLLHELSDKMNKLERDMYKER